MILCGEFKHALDAKNRLFIPSKHRDEFGENVMIVRDSENKCLLVYSIEEWDKYCAAALDKVPITRRNAVNRYLYRTALKCGFDSQGRVLLTTDLCDHAGLTKGTAVIVGCGDYAEIWNEENYQAKIDEEDPEEILSLLRQYDV